MSNRNNTQDEVHAILAGLRVRKRGLNAVRLAAHGALAGAVLGCFAAFVLRLLADSGPVTLLAMAVATAALTTLVGAVIGGLRRVSDLGLARALDAAASSEDRFASAVELASHPRRERVRLVVDDAVSRVRSVPSSKVFPSVVPRPVKWLPVPALALALIAAFPVASPSARASEEPDIAADQWLQLEKEFREELAKLPEPKTAEERETQRDLEELADRLGDKPGLKDAYKRIAEISDRLAEKLGDSGTLARELSKAGAAAGASRSLKSLASSLKQRQFDRAAGEASDLADQLGDPKNSLDAQEMEAIASDMQRMAEQMSHDQEMRDSCRDCSNAASSMNQKELSQAMKRLSEQLKRCSEQCNKSSGMCKRSDALSELKRRLSSCSSQCQGSKPGESLVRSDRPGAKGGLKPGWGTAAAWNSGALSGQGGAHAPDVAEVMESQGENAAIKAVSADEKARSGSRYAEMYAEFVRKAEADLELETVPPAHREFLRRYFNAIRPSESAPAERGSPAEDPEAGSAGDP